ncbi:RDD family protein [Mycolicibacterium cyprinidarum]|uniref:RDD family protein n=1 Tax=Mycolicibacterium cyprinidarum TaxID=2860311 RepID=A0ABQ4VCB8_9MYCO|nr:RDD family protein [Mycolicibacterium sp. NGTWS0302]GJF19302.1 RDD family protein [Mycolicibacterium sp. NGTWSNA01]
MTSDYPPPPPPGSGQYGHPGSYPPPSGGQQPGGLGLRFAARILDGILVGIVGGILVYAIGMASSIMITGLFTGLLSFAYYVAFEITQGWTPAKKLLGLSVHGPGGAAKPDFRQSAIRNSWTLLPIVPFIGGLLGVIAIVIIAMTINSSPTKQGKHDELAGGTQVVKG